MRLPYIGENTAMMFGGKGGEQALVEVMKEKFNLMKKLRGYAISSICNLAVKVATQILAGKVMRKCRVGEMPTLVISLIAQCVEGV